MQYFEEIEIGYVLELGSHNFTKQEIIEFAEKFDPQRFHVDEEMAKESLFGGLCASGWHTAAAGMRKLVDTRTAIVKKLIESGKPVAKLGPAYGFRNLKWTRPVFPDDTISYSVRIIEKKDNRKRPEWGIIVTLTEASNSDGKLVMSYESQVLVERKQSNT